MAEEKPFNIAANDDASDEKRWVPKARGKWAGAVCMRVFAFDVVCYALCVACVCVYCVVRACARANSSISRKLYPSLSFFSSGRVRESGINMFSAGDEQEKASSVQPAPAQITIEEEEGSEEKVQVRRRIGKVLFYSFVLNAPTFSLTFLVFKTGKE